MIRFFHRYQNSVVVIILIVILCISMAMFGISLPGASSSRAAIKVNETELEYQDVAGRQRELENQMRRQFGEQYAQILQMMGSNLQEQVVDQLVEEALVTQEIKSQGITADPGSVRDVIASLFGENYSADAYQNYLRQVGMSAAQFEARVAQDAARTEFFAVLQDFTGVSEFEARQKAELAESSYTVSYVSVSPSDVMSDVAEPTEEEALAYYEENATKYETPERVQYAAIQIKPDSVLDTVEIYDEDVELYYVENQSEFKNPDRAKVAHIQINYGKESDPDALLAVKARAQKIHERAVAGEDFSSLVLEASDDITTKESGGSLGWLSKGTRDDEIERQALALGIAGITELVETDYGFHVIKVEQFEASSVAELAEVRDEIEKRLRKREAPAYAMVKAEELFESWKSGEESLAKIAEKEGVTLLKAEAALAEENDITPDLRGLTKKVLTNAPEMQQFVEFGSTGILVEVLDHQPVQIPGFEVVKEQVKNDIKSERADELAREKVSAVIRSLQSEKVKTLEAAAKTEGLTVETAKDVNRTNANKPPLTNSSVRQALFASRTPRVLTDSPVLADEAYVAVAVTEVSVPKKGEFDKSLKEYREQATKESAGALQVALIQTAKSESEITVAPGLMNQ